MNKIILILCLFLSNFAFAEKPICGNRNIVCEKNYLPSVDGKCYPCDYPEVVFPECGISAEELCPQRIPGGDGGSYLNCPSDRENVNNKCLFKCPKGFQRVGETETCKNPTTGIISEIMY